MIIPNVDAGSEIQAVPDVQLEMGDESFTVHDDLVVTSTSSVKLLCDACGWLGISQSGSKKRMCDRCKKTMDESYRRNLVESAREQFKAKDVDGLPIPVPAQPSEQECALQYLPDIPFKAWRKFCVMNRARANQHSHVPDPADEAQRASNDSVPFFSWNLAKRMLLMSGRDMLQWHH